MRHDVAYWMVVFEALIIEELHTLRKLCANLQGVCMNTLETFKKINKEELIDRFIYELPILRSRVGMTQDEISEIIGVSRQTYSSIETRKRKLPWTTYMSLLMVFYFNPDTREALESADLFPEELKNTLMINHRREENWGGR